MCLSSRKKKQQADSNELRFVRLIDEGKVSAALRCIGSLQCGVHEITHDVLKVLLEKHPDACEADVGSLIQGSLPQKMLYMKTLMLMLYTKQLRKQMEQGHHDPTRTCGGDFSVQSSTRTSQLTCTKLSQSSQRSSTRKLYHPLTCKLLFQDG